MSAANNGGTTMQYGLLTRPRSRRIETDTPPPIPLKWRVALPVMLAGGVLSWCAIGAAAWLLFFAR